jgi:hypothetical protein
MFEPSKCPVDDTVANVRMLLYASIAPRSVIPPCAHAWGWGSVGGVVMVAHQQQQHACLHVHTLNTPTPKIEGAQVLGRKANRPGRIRDAMAAQRLRRRPPAGASQAALPCCVSGETLLALRRSLQLAPFLHNPTWLNCEFEKGQLVRGWVHATWRVVCTPWRLWQSWQNRRKHPLPTPTFPFPWHLLRAGCFDENSVHVSLVNERESVCGWEQCD